MSHRAGNPGTAPGPTVCWFFAQQHTYNHGAVPAALGSASTCLAAKGSFYIGFVFLTYLHFSSCPHWCPTNRTSWPVLDPTFLELVWQNMCLCSPICLDGPIEKSCSITQQLEVEAWSKFHLWLLSIAKLHLAGMNKLVSYLFYSQNMKMCLFVICWICSAFLQNSAVSLGILFCWDPVLLGICLVLPLELVY